MFLELPTALSRRKGISLKVELAKIPSVFSLLITLRWAWVVNCAHLFQCKTCPSFSTDRCRWLSKHKVWEWAEGSVWNRCKREVLQSQQLWTDCLEVTQRDANTLLRDVGHLISDLDTQLYAYLIYVNKFVVCLSVLVWYSWTPLLQF